jgi:hypothetical protein
MRTIQFSGIEDQIEDFPDGGFKVKRIGLEQSPKHLF